MKQKFSDVMVAGLVVNQNNEFLLQQDDQGKLTFPLFSVDEMPGKTWEILEKNLQEKLLQTTNIKIAEGMIPFTDQEFIGKNGFEQIIIFYICKYGSGEIDPEKKLQWLKFTDFSQDRFLPLIYQVFAKADAFIEKLEKITI